MSATRTDVLIVGAGLAGARTAESLRAAGFDGRVTIAGAEPYAPYERPALSKEYLLGERPAASLALRPARRRVVRELADLPAAPWRSRPPPRGQRARRAIGAAWRQLRARPGS
jgi:NADPH-dependent 2,4-dienoyl-CoA reductase/sulfur reductase-like enzyme